MPYYFAIIAMLAFAAGGGVTYQMSKAEIQHMADGIAAQNKEAELQYANLAEQANKDKAATLNANKQLEDANVSTINAINSQRDAFRSKRLYDTHRARSSCTSTKTTNTGELIDAASEDRGISAELTEFLKSEAYRADEISAYAILCSHFIRGIDYGR